jgi:20S proteasome subunit alpha 5
LLFQAKAIGAGSEGAQSTLQDKYRADMTLLEAENLALEILKQVMEDKVSNLNVELATVTSAGYHIFDYSELDTVIARLA